MGGAGWLTNLLWINFHEDWRFFCYFIIIVEEKIQIHWLKISMFSELREDYIKNVWTSIHWRLAEKHWEFVQPQASLSTCISNSLTLDNHITCMLVKMISIFVCESKKRGKLIKFCFTNLHSAVFGKVREWVGEKKNAYPTHLWRNWSQHHAEWRSSIINHQ